MRRLVLLPLAAAIALSGCGKKEEGAAGGGEAGGVVPSVSDIVMPEPGEYEQTIQIIDMTIPGMDGPMAEQMKKSMLSTTTTTDCLTPEESKEALKKFAEGPRKDGNCTFSKYDVGGGKVDLAMECKEKDGSVGNFTVTGTFGATGSDMTMEGDQSSPNMPGGKMHMKIHMVSERTGECKS